MNGTESLLMALSECQAIREQIGLAYQAKVKECEELQAKLALYLPKEGERVVTTDKTEPAG